MDTSGKIQSSDSPLTGSGQSPFAVRVNEVTKTYDKGKVVAVDKVSFDVNHGELFGLIGPDGAGKTSIFRILTTLLLPDGGEASVMGLDVKRDYKQIRSNVGYMPGKFSLYQDLSVEENLHFFATVFKTTIAENYHLIKDIYVQLEPFKDRRAGKLSGGMKQKLALCCALIHKPEVLFLDEPTTGVDPVSRKEFWEMLRSLKKQGITIVVSTPYMDEATLCDRIALIQGGKILTIDTPDHIIKDYPDSLYAVKADRMYNLMNALKEYAHTSSSNTFGEYIHTTFDKDFIEKSDLIMSLNSAFTNMKDEGAFWEKEVVSYLQRKGLKDISFKRVTPTIEDCFIRLLSTGN